MEDPRVAIASLQERTSSAHKRLDKLEDTIEADLAEIKKDLKVVTAWMNQGRGWSAAALLMSGIIGGAISKALGVFLNAPK